MLYILSSGCISGGALRTGRLASVVEVYEMPVPGIPIVERHASAAEG